MTDIFYVIFPILQNYNKTEDKTLPYVIIMTIVPRPSKTVIILT